MRFTAPIFFVLFSFCLPVAAQARDFEQTCAYFSNTAFNDMHTRQDETFRTTLAKDCSAALDVYRISHPGSEGWRKAEAYLVQLHRYRRTLLDMVNARYDATRAAGSASRGTGGRNMVREVSRTGAYLIARSMGLVGVQREWRNWMQARLDN